MASVLLENVTLSKNYILFSQPSHRNKTGTKNNAHLAEPNERYIVGVCLVCGVYEIVN